MRGDADRLVDHHHVVVVVEHDQAVHRLGGAAAAATGSGMVTSSSAPAGTLALRGRRRAVTVTCRRRSGRRRRCARSPNIREIATSSRSPSSPSGTGSSRVQPSARGRRCSVPSKSHRQQAAARRPGSRRRRLQESARLKIGQCLPSGPNTLIQSTTWPWKALGRPEHPVDQVAQGAAQHQAERDRPASRAHPAGGADDDRDHHDRDNREDHREAGAEREGRAGVARLIEVEQRHRGSGSGRGPTPRQFRGHDDLGSGRRESQHGDHREQPDPPGSPPGGRAGVGVARHCVGCRLTPPLSRTGRAESSAALLACLHTTSSVAAGNALSRAFGIGLPQLSQKP